MRIDNSFFHQDLSGTNVMVIVPHEDDEINTSGALISALAGCNAKINLVYTTNGDYKYAASTRMREAAAAASVLGIPKDRLLFLGYGDFDKSCEQEHIFYAIDQPARSHAGFTETYGTELYDDYCYASEGIHRAYTKDNYLSDIVSVIESIRPDLIICTDFDEHPDHRMLALSFDRAIGIIRRRDPEYKPQIWKRFAYSLAYTAAADYSAVNNPETVRPVVGTTGKYNLDIIDTSIYRWDDRIRIPVVDHGDKPLRDTTIGRALLEHRSQRIITHADRIMNSDEVYWRRRTDGVGYQAKIETSSGNGAYLNDFMLFNVCDVDTPVPAFKDYCWMPEEQDQMKRAVFTWDEPQTIEQIVLYGAIDDHSQIEKLQVTLSDGHVFMVDGIPCNGNPVYVDTGHCEGIVSCEIAILRASGDSCGLSECEFYPSIKAPEYIRPFMKILVDGNFAYEYVISDSVRSINIGLYCYKTDEAGPIRVVAGNSRIEGNRLLIDPDDREIILRVEDKNAAAWDQAAIRIVSAAEWENAKQKINADRKYIRKQKRSLRIHNMLYILRHQGLSAVLKRTKQNGIWKSE